MEILSLLVSSLLALLGVLLGGALSSRTQERTWQRERTQRLEETLRETYAGFLGAARRYRAYVMDPEADIKVVPHPAGRSPLPLLGEQARPYKDAYESAWADILLLAGSSGTIEKADSLRRALYDLAGARATYGAGAIPEPLVQAVRDTERSFRDAARIDLGMPAHHSTSRT